MNAHTLQRTAALAVALWLGGCPPLVAQEKLLSLDDIYDPGKRVNFNGNPSPPIAWIDGTHFVWGRQLGRESVDWLKSDATTGVDVPLFDAAKMESALMNVAGIGGAEARTFSHERSTTFNRTYTAAIVPIDDDLYVYDFETVRAVRLTNAAGSEEHPTFSPDGRSVAFVRNNNLFVVDLSSGRERALTTDGTTKVLNGRMDWVYEEEIYGRGHNRAYWWSPDSASLAFLRIDDTPIPNYPVVDHIPYEQTVEQWAYPKAGDPNPLVKLAVARIDGTPAIWIDTSKYAATDLIVRVGWTPDSRQVVYEAQNRTQTWLDLNLANAASGATQNLFRQTSKYWIGSEDVTLPVWLKDGSFLWLSDRSGWQHLYRFKADGSLIKQLTSGNWELRTLHGVDEGQGWVYFSGTAISPIGADIFRIRLDGTRQQRLSTADGTHSADFSPSLAFYIDSWSNVTTPAQTRLHRNDGSAVRVLDENKVAALGEYSLAKPEFLHVKTRDGFEMEAMMLKPSNFDPARRYPVYQFTYGGPHAPQVRNTWGGTQYLYHQLLAQKGIIVWICDNRTASGKGSESVWPLHKNFGEVELRDIEDGVTWLKRQPYVDGARIGIHGWSYGGFMTSYALTHSRSFVMGIAGGTVADWRDYDTVYTERYMGLPSENPDGYRKSSPRFAAADLQGALMLIHGTIDDNVHMANTLQFAYELQKAQKPFQLMLYPKSRHGVTDPELVKHLRSSMLSFALDHLRPDASN